MEAALAVPLTDVSRVTTAVATLISQALERDNFPDPVEVSAAPPEDEPTVPNSISVHLFHIIEDPHRKNLPPVRAVVSRSPVQYTQLGLILNYVITARNTIAADRNARALTEQRLLGFVARALHDFPVITDTTTVPSVPPSPPNPPILQTANLSGGNNEIEVILRPVGIDEGMNFWSAEQDRPARLALFYEVRVILLDTPPVTSTPGIVLSLGGFISVSGQPFLETVQNLLAFTLPPGTPAGPALQVVRANPARVALFPAGAVPPEVPADNNRFRIEGADLRDERTFLALRGPAGVGLAAPTERSFRIDLDGGANPTWTFDVRDTEISVAMRQDVENDEGTVLTLYPGLFSLRVLTARQLPGDPSGRRIEQSGNEVVFAIIPQVVTVTSLGGPAAARRFRLTVFGSYLRDELDIQLSAGGTVLRRDPATATAGNYDIVSTSAIEFAVNTTDRRSPLPVNLLINGAGSTPAWAVF
jgi:hypothetical protein